MDMSNATSAGPSHGLLDLIFGTAKKEDAKSQEEHMDSISALVKALEKNSKKIEEKMTENSKSDMEANKSLLGPEHSNPGSSPEATSMSAKDTKKDPQTDAALLEIAGGNPMIAMLLQKMNPNPEVLRAIQNGDTGAVMKLIDARKSELKGQMPALGLLEKAIERDGLENVVSAASITQLIAKFEDQYANQNKIRKGSATEDFLAAKGLKVNSLEAQSAQAADDSDGVMAGMVAFGSGAESLGMGKPDSAASSLAGNANIPGQVPAGESAKITDAAKVNEALRTNEMLNPLQAAAKQAGAHGLTTSEAVKGAKGAKDGLPIKDLESAKGLPLDNSQTAGAAAGGAALGADLTSSQGPYASVDLNSLSRDGIRSNLVPRLAHNVSYVAKLGGGEMTMTVNPRDLGEVKLKITTSGQRVDVEVIAQNADVANAVKASSKDLADALSTQKLTLAGMEVSVKAGGNSSETAFQNNSQQQGGSFANLNGQSQNQQNNASGDGSLGSHGNSPREQQAREHNTQTGQALASSPAKKSSSNVIDLQA